MDLTPLDIRKKEGDFTRGFREYDQQQGDQYLDLMAERVQGQEDRERAVQEAFVSAQSPKQDIQEQAKREADLIFREARVDADRSGDEGRKLIQNRDQELVYLGRARFLKGLLGLRDRGRRSDSLRGHSRVSAV